MKKLLSILLALVLATGLFAACSGSGSGSQAAGKSVFLWRLRAAMLNWGKILPCSSCC